MKKSKTKTSKRIKLLDKHGSAALIERVFLSLKEDVMRTSEEYGKKPYSENLKDRLCIAIIDMALNPLVSFLDITLKDVLLIANKNLPEDKKITIADLLIREDMRFAIVKKDDKGRFKVVGKKKKPEDI